MTGGDIYKFLEMLMQNTVDPELVVIATDIDGEALQTFVLNHTRGSLKCLAISAPMFANRQKDILEDIAILTGGQVISRERGDKLEEVTIEQLGRADKVWSDANKTKIIGGKGIKE